MSSDARDYFILLLYLQAATAKVCCECGLRLTGVYYTREDGSVVCEQDWRAGLPSCPACSRPVEGNLVKVSNSSYHPTCFTCCQCAAPLAGLPFHLAGPGRALHCAGCYARKHAAVCSACQRPVLPEPGSNTAQRLRALGRDFHPDCFRCQVPAAGSLVLHSVSAGLLPSAGLPGGGQRVLPRQQPALLLLMLRKAGQIKVKHRPRMKDKNQRLRKSKALYYFLE